MYLLKHVRIFFNEIIENNFLSEDRHPDRKKYSLLKDKYFCKDNSIRYLHSKIFEYAQ